MAESSEKYYNPNSLLGFMNLFKRKRLDMGNPLNRPTFPPITSEPSIAQIFRNLNASDLGLGLASGLAINVTCSLIVAWDFRNAPVSVNPEQYYKVRGSVLRLSKLILFAFVPALMLVQSQQRLMGKVYNGREWKVRQNRFRRFKDARQAFDNRGKILI